MRLTGSRAYTRPTPTPKMPPGLVELMEGLTRDVLKNNPDDLYEFCAGHMQKLLDIRDGKPRKKQMSLEQKIKRAQEKVREKIQNRLLQQNETAKHSNESQEKEKIKQVSIESTLEPEMKIPFEGAKLENILEQPVQHEREFVKTISQEQIFHDPSEIVTSNEISEEPVKQHMSELITVGIEENVNNKTILEEKESTTDINAELPINPGTVYIEEMKRDVNNIKESDIRENVRNAPEIDHLTSFVETNIVEKENEVDVKTVIPESLPNPSSFDKLVELIEDKIIEPKNNIIEPTNGKIIEPIIDKIIEPTKDKIIEPTIESIIEPAKDKIIESTKDEIIEPTKDKVIEHTKDKVIELTKDKVIEPTKDKVIEPTKEELIEPTRNKIIEPFEHKITEITNDSKLLAEIEQGVESKHVIKDSITRNTESVSQATLNRDVPSDLIIDTYKLTEPAVDNINEMESKVHNETFPSSEFKSVKRIKSTSLENAAVPVQKSNEILNSDSATHPQIDIDVNGGDVEKGQTFSGTMENASCPSESKIVIEHVIEPEHITEENINHNTGTTLQTVLDQDLSSNLKPEKPAHNNFQVECTDDMEPFFSSESKIEKGTVPPVPVQEPSVLLNSQSIIPPESTLINKPTQMNKNDADFEKEVKSSENDSIENGTVHVDCESRSNTEGNNYDRTDSKEIKNGEENHDESSLDKPRLKSKSNEVNSVSINNPKMSTNTETQSENETQDLKTENTVVPDIVKHLESSISQDNFVNSELIDMPSHQNLIDTAHKFLHQEREHSSSVMEEKAIVSKKVTLLGNDDITTGEKDEHNEKSTVGGMDLETAAITIQKVFRTFLFSKSRTSTLDDAVNENSLDEDIDKKDAAEYVMSSVNLNKERRPLGISRMDTVLQTVNEEKSQSQSTDDSSLSSAATTIQAHVRGFLVRNKLASYKTNSNSSLINSDGPSTVSLDGDGSEHKKTILNIHIVPERGQFMSRDESVLTSIDLPLDISPLSSINLHPLGYDKSEPRKQLKREDAIQSFSPPSNNSEKLSEEVDSVKDLLNQNNEQEQSLSLITNDQRQEDADSCDTTLTISSTADTIVDAEAYNHRELLSSPDHNLDAGTKNKEAMENFSSDEMDVVTPFPNADKTIFSSDSESKDKPKLVHSGEFHDMVVQTQVKRSESSVVREFKNVLVYFLLWDKT